MIPFRTRRPRLALVSLSLLALVALCLPAAPAPTTSQPFKNVLAIGKVAVTKDTLTVKDPTATVVIGDKNSDTYRVTAEYLPVSKAGSISIQVMPTESANFDKPAALHAYISRDAPGLWLQSGRYRLDAKTGKWTGNEDITYHNYWPAQTDKAGQALVDKLAKRSWHGRWLPLRVEADRRHVRLWLDGRLLNQVERPAGSRGPVALKLSEGDQLRAIQLVPLAADSVYLPVNLGPEANDRFAKPVGKPALQLGGVHFEVLSGERDQLSLRKAQWIEWKTDPADYYEWYDNGPPILHDERMPFLRVPVADYTAAHLLAVADDDPKTVPVLTLRAGRYGWSEQVVQHEFPGQVPRRGQAARVDPKQVIQTPAGPLFHVRVPMTDAFAQDLDRFMDIELTKEIRLARRHWDPNRFRQRPLGLPSGVRIAALTLERSPLQIRVGSKESGHAFVEPQKPTFQVRLQNITAAEQSYQLTVTATHLDGTRTEVKQAGKVAVGKTAEPAIVVPTSKRGYHDLVVTLADGTGRVLLRRRTSFALLPPDTRKHRDRSPFGTWDFCGGHFTSNNPDETGPLYVKLGLRHGMFAYKPEQRKKYGILQGNEPNVLAGAKVFEDYLKTYPDAPPIALLFHETGISGKHLSRVPDLFHDRPAYVLDAQEKKDFQKLWDEVSKAAREMRAKFPRVHLRLGNGALPMKEEMYRRKFPANLFDSGGNESGSFGRMPEAQPPDCVAHNAGIWMDRQMLDAYGYKDKPVTQCLEICYPNTNPGNLTVYTQADYLVRHCLHSLAWKIPQIKVACISDMGNSYYFSNWGANGFCHRKPELNVKPSFVAMATMTRVLDGAKFLRVVPLGSQSLYALEFRLPDGKYAYALWTVRGRRPVSVRGDKDATSWKRIDDQGNETDLAAPSGRAEVTLTPTPVYLVGKGRLTGATPGQPQYDDKPAGKSAVLSSLASLNDWTVEKERNPELEYYDMMCPRRQGDFAFKAVDQFDNRKEVLQVTPRPIKHGKATMPMYAVLAHKKGIPVPGKPTEVGVWVNGNSSWGRLMFEFTDASGQRWISIGAEQPDIPKNWLEDVIPKEARAKFGKLAISDWNTEDVFGISRINFDGWRWLAFPLPGNYPGEGYAWPANSQWRWDRDGVVHYPLTFKKLIVELPEKMLHVQKFAPPVRPEIYLKDLTVGQDKGP